MLKLTVHTLISVCVDVIHTVSNVQKMIHKLKAMFTIEVFVCTGENEGTTHETTSGIGGKQQCGFVRTVIKLCFSISELVKVNSSHSVIPVCVDVFHTLSNVHKLKAMFTIEVFVCTGENEGT